MTSTARPVARLSSPGEVVAIVPVLCGFVPQESLVVVSLRGRRSRIGLTMRFDLGWAASDPLAAAEEVAARLALDGAVRCLLVVFSSTPGPLAWSGLVDQVSDACSSGGIAVKEALLVRDDRWWSYVCQDDRCCPSDGTPLAAASSAALELVEAERVLEGRAVLASREELVASIAPPTGPSRHDAVDRAVDAWLDRFGRVGREAVRAHEVASARALLGRVTAGSAVSTAEAAALAVGVQDVRVRDEVATWCLDEQDALLSMLLQTSRLVPPPEDAAVLVLLAWVAYAHGDGGLANVALDRCLRSDPDCTLARLMLGMLDRQVPPSEVRRLLRDTAALLARS